MEGNMSDYLFRGLIALGIIVSALVIYRIGVMILRQLMKKWFNAALFYPTVKWFWKFIIFIVAAASVFKYALYVSTASVLTALGIGGATIAVAAQGFIKDLIMGCVILVGNNYQIGDVIIVKNSLKGRVDKITLQNTRLVDEAGNKHIISNSEMTMVTISV